MHDDDQEIPGQIEQPHRPVRQRRAYEQPRDPRKELILQLAREFTDGKSPEEIERLEEQNKKIISEGHTDPIRAAVSRQAFNAAVDREVDEILRLREQQARQTAPDQGRGQANAHEANPSPQDLAAKLVEMDPLGGHISSPQRRDQAAMQPDSVDPLAGLLKNRQPRNYDALRTPIDMDAPHAQQAGQGTSHHARDEREGGAADNGKEVTSADLERQSRLDRMPSRTLQEGPASTIRSRPGRARDDGRDR